MKRTNPLCWIPSLYFFQGVPYIFLTLVSVVIYKSCGLSNPVIAFCTSLLFFPWVLKPLMAPYLEKYATMRQWVLSCQCLVALLLICFSLTLLGANFFKPSFALLLVIGVCAAAHDTAADGIYLTKLSVVQKSAYLGVQNGFYQLARFFCVSILIALAGVLSKRVGPVESWQIAITVAALVLFTLCIFHLKTLPAVERSPSAINQISFLTVGKEFFKNENALVFFCFIFFFNAADAQLDRIFPLFFLDKHAHVGMVFSVMQLSLLLSVGAGVFLGGVFSYSFFLSRKSISQVIIPASLLACIANLLLILLTTCYAASFIGTVLIFSITQYAFGLVNAMYMAHLMRTVSCYPHRMSSYALCTTLMAASFMCFGMLSSLIIRYVDYQIFFIYVFIIHICITMFVCLAFKGDRDESVSRVT